jgi:hypothetical protein
MVMMYQMPSIPDKSDHSSTTIGEITMRTIAAGTFEAKARKS